METEKSLDLEPIITAVCYKKNETLTATEIRQAIAEAMTNFGIEYVTTLPTGNNIKEKIYVTPDTTQSTGNFGDIYIYDKTNTKWIHVDGLKFNIADYVLIADIKDNLTSTDTNKPLSAKQGKELKTLVDGKASSSHTHGSVSNTGTLNSDISSVNKVVVTDSNNNIKTISKLPENKVTHQDITGKVNITDIRDNLTSTDTNKPLSANQGKVLKGLIDGKASTSHSHTMSDLTNLTVITLTINYDDNTSSTYRLFGEEI